MNKLIKDCFPYRGRYFYMNISMIPSYLRRRRFLLKHGFDMSAFWSTSSWFTGVMKDVLRMHLNDRCGTPLIVSDTDFKKNEVEWDRRLKRMLELLEDMDEFAPKFEKMDLKEAEAVMLSAKREFFELFSENFYLLWD